jgi:hypothetical protein
MHLLETCQEHPTPEDHKCDERTPYPSLKFDHGVTPLEEENEMPRIRATPTNIDPQ